MSSASGKQTNLIESRQGEVLSEWMSLESVISEDTTEIGVVVEPDAVHVVHLRVNTW